MIAINGFQEVGNPLFVVLPTILMIFAGYTIGTLISKYLTKNRSLLKDLFIGNIVLNLIFVTFFIIFADFLDYSDTVLSFSSVIP